MAAIALVVGLCIAGCPGKKTTEGEPDAKGPRVHGLTPKEAAEVLARVGDVEITAGDLAARLAEQSPYLRSQYESPERRREFLENMVRFELLAQEAKKRGLYDLPEVQRARKQAMIEELLKQEIGNSVTLASVSDEEVRIYYESHVDEFNRPEQVRASQIVVAQEALAKKLLAELSSTPQDAELFRRRASEHTADATGKAKFGDLGFFSRPGIDPKDEVPAPIAEAAFAIEAVGGVYPEALRIGGAFHIVKLTAKRAALHRNLDDARRSIQQQLWRQKRKAATDRLIERLRAEAKLAKDERALDEVQLDLPTATPGIPPADEANEAAAGPSGTPPSDTPPSGGGGR